MSPTRNNKLKISKCSQETLFNLLCRSDFNWVKMLRYYWVKASETVEVKMSSTTLPYFYEYLGAGGVLVILQSHCAAYYDLRPLKCMFNPVKDHNSPNRSMLFMSDGRSTNGLRWKYSRTGRNWQNGNNERFGQSVSQTLHRI